MMQVWFLFKILEAILGTIAMIFHTLGFMNKEPLPHVLIFCGTFFGFALLSGMEATAIAIGATPPVLIECVINFCAAVMYILASIVSMHHAENDFHLMYLSDFEEPLHPYFAFCRAQGVCALAAGAMHLLHGVLAFDVLFIPKNVLEGADISSSESDDDTHVLDTRRPIRMYFLSRFIEKKMRHFEWFDRLCKRKYGAASLHSLRVSRSSAAIPQAVSSRKSVKHAEKKSAEPEDDSSESEKELRETIVNYSDFKRKSETDRSSKTGRTSSKTTSFADGSSSGSFATRKIGPRGDTDSPDFLQLQRTTAKRETPLEQLSDRGADYKLAFKDEKPSDLSDTGKLKGASSKISFKDPQLAESSKLWQDDEEDKKQKDESTSSEDVVETYEVRRAVKQPVKESISPKTSFRSLKFLDQEAPRESVELPKLDEEKEEAEKDQKKSEEKDKPVAAKSQRPGKVDEYVQTDVRGSSESDESLAQGSFDTAKSSLGSKSSKEEMTTPKPPPKPQPPS